MTINLIKVQGPNLFMLFAIILIALLLLTIVGGKANIKELSVSILQVFQYNLKK